MTQSPEEKAKLLVGRFMEFTPAEEEFELPYAKQCAIICVQREIDSYNWFFAHHYSETVDMDITKAFVEHIKELEATKQAIEKL